MKENKEKNTNHKVVEEKTFDLMEKMTRNIRTHKCCTKAVFNPSKILEDFALEVGIHQEYNTAVSKNNLFQYKRGVFLWRSN